MQSIIGEKSVTSGRQSCHLAVNFFNHSELLSTHLTGSSPLADRQRFRNLLVLLVVNCECILTISDSRRGQLEGQL